jgi:hypothetical protein
MKTSGGYEDSSVEGLYSRINLKKRSQSPSTIKAPVLAVGINGINPVSLI